MTTGITEEMNKTACLREPPVHPNSDKKTNLSP